MGRFAQLAFLLLAALAVPGQVDAFVVPAATLPPFTSNLSPLTTTCAYDHRGRMVRKEISHRGTEARRMGCVWDGWNIIREVQWSVASDQWSVISGQ